MIETLLKTSLDTMTATTKMVNVSKDENFVKNCNTFLDTQNDAAKKSVDSACDFGRELYANLTKKEFYSDSLKAFNFFNNKK